MGKLIVRKDLTPEQYRRANFTMCTILILCYLVYIVVELMNVGKNGMHTGIYMRCGVYAAVLLATLIVYKLTAQKKACMIFFSITFLITYAVLVFGNGVVVMMLVFPALIGLIIMTQLYCRQVMQDGSTIVISQRFLNW